MAKTINHGMTSRTANDEAQSFAEYLGVVTALQPYIDAAKTGHVEHMRASFYDHAHIIGSMEGTIHNLDADEFAGVVKGNESPNVEHHLAWIDISGPAAAARVEFLNWNGFRFTDFFVLYKQDGKWKISGKVYDSHNKN
ncbi:MAG: nuclear transport factor 2 family protein [Deltaproteobacteria bacterium]|nr:nuclear transport factor 2 family protein [Deltaproteobacteria bacterium]